MNQQIPLFQSMRPGDVLIGQVQQRTFHGLVVRILATDSGTHLRDMRDLSVKVVFVIVFCSPWIFSNILILGCNSSGSPDSRSRPQRWGFQQWGSGSL
jgi:hypothetical protein